MNNEHRDTIAHNIVRADIHKDILLNEKFWSSCLLKMNEFLELKRYGFHMSNL